MVHVLAGSLGQAWGQQLLIAAIGVAGGLLGVLLKMAYDRVAERRQRKNEKESQFVTERKEAYEKFLRLRALFT
ncbi:hypothetical protein [Saccharopolyspora spinosa]|uniref:hypothetical protein n=1 Tax=Saccharopolyspora spinosa TaxID=60894 RepID=UPI003BAA70EC